MGVFFRRGFLQKIAICLSIEMSIPLKLISVPGQTLGRQQTQKMVSMVGLNILEKYSSRREGDRALELQN